MNLYSNKYKFIFLGGCLLSIIFFLFLLITNKTYIHFSLLSLSIFMFLQSLTKENIENEFVIKQRYNALLIVFTVTIATLNSFVIASNLISTLIITKNGILNFSIFILAIYNIIFRIKLHYSERFEKALSNKLIIGIYILILILSLSLSIFVYIN